MIDWFDGIELKQTEKNKIRSENIYIMSFNKCGLRTQKLNWNFRIIFSNYISFWGLLLFYLPPREFAKCSNSYRNCRVQMSSFT